MSFRNNSMDDSKSNRLDRKQASRKRPLDSAENTGATRKEKLEEIKNYLSDSQFFEGLLEDLRIEADESDESVHSVVPKHDKPVLDMISTDRGVNRQNAFIRWVNYSNERVNHVWSKLPKPKQSKTVKANASENLKHNENTNNSGKRARPKRAQAANVIVDLESPPREEEMVLGAKQKSNYDTRSASLSSSVAKARTAAENSSRPIQQLDFRVRLSLCARLNKEDPFGRDWKGLASRFGYDFNEILMFESENSPADALLDVWGQSSKSTIDSLAQELRELGRNDLAVLLLPVCDAPRCVSSLEA